MFFGDTFIFWCLMALEKSFALSAQYLGRLDICGGNIRAFHILSVGGYLVAWALNCSPSHDLPCVCAELTHTWFPSQHHANTYNLTLNTTRLANTQPFLSQHSPSFRCWWQSICICVEVNTFQQDPTGYF